MTIVTIHQPEFFPYHGFFLKILLSDIFIVLDDVDYKKNNVQNRNRFYCESSWRWAGVTVSKGNLKLIKQKRIESDPAKFFNTLREWYRSDDLNIINELEKKTFNCKSLADFNLQVIEYVLDKLDYKGKIIRSSSLNVYSQKSERLIDLLKNVEARLYISGRGAIKYLDFDLFRKNDIGLAFLKPLNLNYRGSVDERLQNLSFLDAVMCLGWQLYSDQLLLGMASGYVLHD